MVPHICRWLTRAIGWHRRTVANMITMREVMDGKLASVTMPVLIVWGKQDIMTPPSIAEEMRREMPHSVLVVLDDCGHLAPIECHDRVLAEIERFLSANQPLPSGMHEVPAQ